MKTPLLSLLALCPALLLAACSSPRARVTHTEVATGAVNPQAIYIRPFPVAYGQFDRCSPSGNRPIRAALASVEFANDLQEELSKIAPARVLAPGEDAPVGWRVDGWFEAIESGYAPCGWNPFRKTASRPSCLKLHIRVTDVCRSRCGGDGVVYAFDVQAGTRAEGVGSPASPGLGYPLPFDFRNTAELIALTLTPDPFRYGVRTSPEMRY